MVSISDITPVGLCLVTQELLDSKRFCEYFGDNLILRFKDKGLEQTILPIKKDLNSLMARRKFLQGHKAVIISNIDKILALVSARYSKIDLKEVEKIILEGKELVKKVAFTDSFENLSNLAPRFRSKIALPVYSLFLKYEKRKV
jgi:hypothetical protein